MRTSARMLTHGGSVSLDLRSAALDVILPRDIRHFDPVRRIPLRSPAALRDPVPRMIAPRRHRVVILPVDQGNALAVAGLGT
jgi:hypothetical protein